MDPLHTTHKEPIVECTTPEPTPPLLVGVSIAKTGRKLLRLRNKLADIKFKCPHEGGIWDLSELSPLQRELDELELNEKKNKDEVWGGRLKINNQVAPGQANMNQICDNAHDLIREIVNLKEYHHISSNAPAEIHKAQEFPGYKSKFYDYNKTPNTDIGDFIEREENTSVAAGVGATFTADNPKVLHSKFDYPIRKGGIFYGTDFDPNKDKEGTKFGGLATKNIEVPPQQQQQMPEQEEQMVDIRDESEIPSEEEARKIEQGQRMVCTSHNATACEICSCITNETCNLNAGNVDV